MTTVEAEVKRNIQNFKENINQLSLIGNNLNNGKPANLDTAIAGADARLASLQKETKDLDVKIATTKQKVNSLNKDFLENIYSGNPEASSVPTLQDLTLLVFWFGWIMLVGALFTIRVLSPGADWKIIIITFSLLLFATIILYSMLRQFA
jgi:hypothetical protein